MDRNTASFSPNGLPSSTNNYPLQQTQASSGSMDPLHQDGYQTAYASISKSISRADLNACELVQIPQQQVQQLQQMQPFPVLYPPQEPLFPWQPQPQPQLQPHQPPDSRHATSQLPISPLHQSHVPLAERSMQPPQQTTGQHQQIQFQPYPQPGPPPIPQQNEVGVRLHFQYDRDLPYRADSNQRLNVSPATFTLKTIDSTPWSAPNASQLQNQNTPQHPSIDSTTGNWPAMAPHFGSPNSHIYERPPSQSQPQPVPGQQTSMPVPKPSVPSRSQPHQPLPRKPSLAGPPSSTPGPFPFVPSQARQGQPPPLPQRQHVRRNSDASHSPAAHLTGSPSVPSHKPAGLPPSVPPKPGQPPVSHPVSQAHPRPSQSTTLPATYPPHPPVPQPSISPNTPRDGQNGMGSIALNSNSSSSLTVSHHNGPSPPTTHLIPAPNLAAQGGQPINYSERIVNDVMAAALAPVQTNIEQLWSNMVTHFRGVIERMNAGFLSALQAERARTSTTQEQLASKEEVGKALQVRVGWLEREVANLNTQLGESKRDAARLNTELGVNKSAMVMAQQEAVRLVEEKGRLQVKLTALELVQKQMAEVAAAAAARKGPSGSGSADPEFVVEMTGMVQKEVAEQVQQHLQAAFKENQQLKAEKASAEEKLQLMMKKMKDSLDGVNAASSPVVDPSTTSRDTSTAVSSPSPKEPTHSRHSSSDSIHASPIHEQNQIQAPSSSAPNLPQAPPLLLRAASDQGRPSIPPPPASMATPSQPVTSAALDLELHRLVTSSVGPGGSKEAMRYRTGSPISLSANRALSVSTATEAVMEVDKGAVAGVKRTSSMFQSESGDDVYFGEPAPVRRRLELMEGSGGEERRLKKGRVRFEEGTAPTNDNASPRVASNPPVDVRGKSSERKNIVSVKMEEKECGDEESESESGSEAPPPRLSFRHLDLLYVTVGSLWYCRLCKTLPRTAGVPKAKFPKDTNLTIMLEHSHREHPVACSDMARLSPTALAEMRMRVVRR